MKNIILKILLFILCFVLILSVLCSCGTSDRKSGLYLPPAEALDIEVSGSSQLEINGMYYSYDEEGRLSKLVYEYLGVTYRQGYRYDDNKNIEIITVSDSSDKVISCKIITEVELPAETGFSVVDGYLLYIPDGGNSESGQNEYNSNTVTSESDTNIDEDEAWIQMYLNTIDEYVKEHSEETPGFQLIYLDEDDIPELVIDSFPGNDKGILHLYCIFEDAVCNMDDFEYSPAVTDSTSYIPGSGLLSTIAFDSDMNREYILSFKDGQLVKIAQGSYDNSDDESFKWNGESVSREEYYDMKDEVFYSGMMYFFGGGLTYEEIKEEIHEYE